MTTSKSRVAIIASFMAVISLCVPLSHAQQALSVPRLVQFSGILKEAAGKHVVGVTFALYKDQQGGAPVWMETQNVPLDESGQYTVMLGATKNEGLPMEVFHSGEARWLGVQPEGQPEQSRALLLSVPYALKAADAETVGGLPASAFVLAAPPLANSTANSSPAADSATPAPALAGSGTTDFIPLWTDSTGDLGNSVMFQLGTGSTAKIGINTTTPSTALDVKGGATIRGVFTLPATGIATATAGKNSQPLNLSASSFNSGTAAAVSQTFRFQSEPAANNTSNPSGTLNLLFGQGTAAPAETGLKIARNGQITFAPGQTFPGGAGTVTSVGLSAPASDFTVSGSPVTTSGTLALNWTLAPTNAATANAIVKRDSNGGFSAGAVAANTSAQNAVSGISATGDGGYFKGGNSGMYAESDTDADLNTAASGWQFGATRETFGVFGYAASPYGVGVFGRGISYSATSYNFPPYAGTGVWGDTSGTGGTAVYGTADDGAAFVGENNGPSGTAYLYNLYTGSGASVLEAFGPAAACIIDTFGNLSCTGSKSAVVLVENGARKVALYAVEAPENWFEDFGSGRLSSGEASISLERTFAQTVNTATDYHVFLTPNGDCNGLYVALKTATSFEVRELGGGKSDVPFDYRIVARRKGYENIRLADKTEAFSDAHRRPVSARNRNVLSPAK